MGLDREELGVAAVKATAHHSQVTLLQLYRIVIIFLTVSGVHAPAQLDVTCRLVRVQETRSRLICCLQICQLSIVRLLLLYLRPEGTIFGGSCWFDVR